MEKRLYRSTDNVIIWGVCGGLGEYFNVDPVLVRVLYLLATMFMGVLPGLVAYVLAYLVMPLPGHSSRIMEIIKDEHSAV